MSLGGWKWGTVVFGVILVWSGECHGGRESCGELVHRVVRALDGALGFFDREYGMVNLDAVVGVRMAQGQLQAALSDLGSAQSPGLKPFRNELQRLSDRAQAICDQAIPVVKRQYPKDYEDLGPLISGDFWSVGSRKKRLTDRSLGINPREDDGWEPLSEPLTDRCISQLLGTKTEPCSITSFCWLAMTPRGYRSYSLSHQVLYLTVGSLMGCESHIQKRLHGSGEDMEDRSVLDSLTDGFCSDVLSEVEATAEEGYPSETQDLFMEQVLLCGLKGYEDFFRLPWLQAVLSWQDDSGCFKEDVYRPHASDVEIDDPKNVDVSTPGHVRKRRRENEVKGTGCLMHKTAVGTGFLSIYLRILIDAMATGETETNCL